MGGDGRCSSFLTIPLHPSQLQSADLSPSGSETGSSGERQGQPDGKQAGKGLEQGPGAAVSVMWAGFCAWRLGG